MNQKFKDVFKGKVVNKDLTINTGVDDAQKCLLAALGYRVVEIRSDHLDDGLRDLAQRLDRPDLVQ